MKILFKNSGLTLVELVVSSVLISIILLGIVAFNTSMDQIQNSDNYNNISNFEASVAMSYLRNDIMMASGDPTNVASQGIRTYIAGTDHSLCLQMPDGTLMDWSDNLWTCYIFDSASQHLVRCTNVPAATVNSNFDNISDCPALQSRYLAKLENGDFFDAAYIPGDPLTITLEIAKENSFSPGTGYIYSSTIKPNITTN